MAERAGWLKIKRVYDAPGDEDGTRVLVDRIWPRGLTKQRAAVALWLKEIAPTDALRKWFAHDVARWSEFRTRYRNELDKNGEEVRRLRDIIEEGPVTLLYGARDEAHNNAVVLIEYLRTNAQPGNEKNTDASRGNAVKSSHIAKGKCK